MYGRWIDVDKDYDSGFILVDGSIGHKIDEGFKLATSVAGSGHHQPYMALAVVLLRILFAAIYAG